MTVRKYDSFMKPNALMSQTPELALYAHNSCVPLVRLAFSLPCSQESNPSGELLEAPSSRRRFHTHQRRQGDELFAL